MKMKLVMVLLFLVPAMATAKVAVKEKASKLSPKEVESVLANYRKAPAVQAKVKKTVIQQTMGTEMKSQGDFYFSKGKMRFDISEPDRTTLVYDGKIIWFESRLDQEHITVTKMRANQLRKSDSILAALFDRKDVFKSFNLLSHKKDSYVFAPKDKKKSDVQKLEIQLKEKEIASIAYTDQIENKVILDFSDVTKGKVAKDKFTYTPPKGAEVTEQ